jgi:hypothetical protein
MKKIIFSLILLTLFSGTWGLTNVYALTGSGGIANAVSQQDLTTKTDSTTLNAIPEEAQNEKPFDWKGLIIGLFFVGFYCYAIAMIAITLLKNKKIEPVTKAQIIAMRKQANKSEEASQEENQKVYDLLEDIFNSWKVISGKGEEELRSPMHMSVLKNSKELHAKAVSLMPTDDFLIERINQLGEVLNNQEKRSFAGSWKLIILAGVATLVVYFMSKSDTSGFWEFLKHWWWMPLSIVLYYFASLAPNFLITKRAQWFKNRNIHNALIGGMLGLLMATPATETYITTWSDGKKTKSEEINAFYIVLLFITFFVLMVLAFLTIIFAGINFIRNYVAYV